MRQEVGAETEKGFLEGILGKTSLRACECVPTDCTVFQSKVEEPSH